MAVMISFSLCFLSLLVGSQAAESSCEEELLKPLVLESNYSSIMGKWILFEVMSHKPLEFLQTVNSSWLEFAHSPIPGTITMSQMTKKIHGDCQFSSVNATLRNSTFYAYESPSIFLQSCSHCLTMRIISKMNHEDTSALYLLTNGTRPSQAAIDDYKKQAECFGLHTEPQFSYDGQTDFCDMKNLSEKQTDPEHKKDE